MGKKKTVVKPKPTVKVDIFAKLSDRTKYTPIDVEMYSKIPIQTQIGYSYKSRDGTLIYIVSAFVQEHYVSESNMPGMVVKCGSRVYLNLYSSIEKVYLKNVDIPTINEKVKHKMIYDKKPVKVSDLERKINILEQAVLKISGKLREPAPVIKKKPVVRRTTSLTHDKKKVGF